MVVSLVFVAAAVEDLDTCTTCMGGGVKKCESGWVYSCVQSGMLNLPEDQRMHNMFDLFNPKKHKFSLNKAWLNSLFFGTLGGGRSGWPVILTPRIPSPSLPYRRKLRGQGDVMPANWRFGTFDGSLAGSWIWFFGSRITSGHWCLMVGQR